MALASLSEASVTQIIVALIVFMGVLITAAGAVVAALFSRSTNREIKYRNGGGVDGTLAERLDARFERIEQRFDRVEDRQHGLSTQHDALREQTDAIAERVTKNVGRMNRIDDQVTDMRKQALDFFNRFYLKERDDEQNRLTDRRQHQRERREDRQWSDSHPRREIGEGEG